MRLTAPGIDAEMADRFPADELQLASLFTIFNYEFYQGMSASEVEKAGEPELKQLLEILSRTTVTNREFYCRQPLIDTADPEVVEVVYVQFRAVRDTLVAEVRSLGQRAMTALINEADMTSIWGLNALKCCDVLLHLCMMITACILADKPAIPRN